MRLNNRGSPDYEVLPNQSGDLTVGYTVHGFKVNEDTQEAYLVVSNTDATESEPTQVYVEKVWSDSVDHSGDSVTVYLLANGIRVQSVILNGDNDWHHTWVNLPKTDAKGNEVVYTVREATVPGYVGEVTVIAPPSSGGGGSSGGGSGTLTPDGAFQNGETYLLQTQYGYIGASGNRVLLENNADTAQNSPETQWVAGVHSNGTVTLTNKAGQTLYYDNYTFKAASSPGTYRNLNFSDGKLFCFIDHGGWSETQYPIRNDNVPNNVIYNGVFYTTGNSAEAMNITLQRMGGATQPEPPSEGEEAGDAFRITNVPAGEATVSLTVRKQWNTGGLGQDVRFEEMTVRMILLANGEDAGLEGILNLRNGWTYTFEGLPKYDSRGSPIQYTVEEIDLSNEWRAEYGPVVGIGDSQTAYETTVTNVYRMTVELPSTGGIGHYGYTVLGVLILLSSLCWYCGQRRKSERRRC